MYAYMYMYMYCNKSPHLVSGCLLWEDGLTEEVQR